MQCTEPSEMTRLFLLPHSKGEIEKKIGSKNSRRLNLFYLVTFDTVLLSSGFPKKLWNENDRLSTSFAFASVLADQQ